MPLFDDTIPQIDESPLAPIQPGRVSQQLTDLRARVKEAIPTGAGLGGANTGNGQLLDILSALRNEQGVAPQDNSVSASDYGHAFVGGAEQLGGSVAAAGEYGAGQLAGENQTPFEQGATDLRNWFTEQRHGAEQAAQSEFMQMSPEAQDRLMREFTTLDPHKTLWQGGTGEFLSSIGLKLAQTAPSSLVTLLPGGLMMRAGLGSGAIAYLGATEGGLSLGSIAQNIADEVEQAPEAELMQSQYYAGLRAQGVDDRTARQQLIQKAQGYTPLIGGAIVGAISAAAGRYLEPVLTDQAAPLMGRFGRGFLSESAQESSQSGVEQLMQNISAQMYDKSRSALQGVGEQAVQGGAIGGIMGGATVAAIGPRPGHGSPQAIPTGEESSPQATPGEPFENVFPQGEQAPSTYRGGDIEFANRDQAGFANQNQNLMTVLEQLRARENYVQNPQASLQRQANLPTDVLNGVNGDVQAAINARRDELQPDMFDQQAAQLAGPGGTDMREVWARNLPLDLQGGQTASTARDLVAPPGQLNLPLRGPRQRGELPQPMGAPMPATGIAQPDLSPPAAVSNERLEQPQIQGKTRADLIRAAQQAERIGRYQGTFKDENQRDLFAEPVQNPDQPSAEPIGDLQAQLRDLQDPDQPRLGVYLSQANIAQLQKEGAFEKVRGVGVPLPNFDGKGGTLIAKDRPSAEALLEMRDTGAANMQELLGFATGAGEGKPNGGTIAVQQRDQQGNVTRESLVATPEEADALAAQWEQEPDRTSVILSSAQAIRRRNQKIKQESRGHEGERETRATALKVRAAAKRNLSEEMQHKAEVKTRGAVSEHEAARDLVNYAARLRKRELAKQIGEVASPESLEFATPEAADRYKELHNEYLGTQVLRNTAKTAEEHNAAKAQQENIGKQIAAFRKLNAATTPSEKVARTALELSREEVQKMHREAAEKAKGKVGSGDVLERVPTEAVQRVSRDELRSMPDAELDVLFTKAAQYIAGRKRSQHTFEEIVAQYPTRSEREKLVARMQGLLTRRQFGGRIKAPPITKSAVTTTEHINMQAAPGAPVEQVKVKRAKRKGGLGTRSLSVEQQAREMSQADIKELEKRASKSFKHLDRQLDSVQGVQTRMASEKFQTLAKHREEGGNPSQEARNVIYGRAYLRTLFEYGRALKQANNRTVAGLRDVETFNELIDKISQTKDDKLPELIGNLFRAETRVQTETATKSDMIRLGNLRNPFQRLKVTLRQISKIRERTAWMARLDNEWHTNGHFEGSVAPLMRKISDSIMVDGWPSYKPTEIEMQRLQFALRVFRGKDVTRERLFKPLKRWFKDLGMEFSGQDLVIPKEDGKYSYSNDKALGSQFRQRFGHIDTDTGLAPVELTREQVTAEAVNRQLEAQKVAAERAFEKDEPLTAPQLERFTKTETVNRGINSLRSQISKSGATTLDIINAENAFIEQLKALDLYKQVSGKRVQITSNGRYGDPINFRPVGDRLRSGELTKAEAVETMLQLYKPIPLSDFTRNTVFAESQRAFNQTRRRVEGDQRKAEILREEAMSPEQRKALDALKRRDELNLELNGLTRDIPSLRRAARAVADTLESGHVTRLNDVLDTLTASLPENNPYRSILKRLRNLDMQDAIIGWDRDSTFTEGAYGKFSEITDRTGEVNRVIRINRPAFERARAGGRDPSGAFVHTIVHEAIHAATAGRLANSAQARESVHLIMQQAKKSAKEQGISIERMVRRTLPGLQVEEKFEEHYGFRDNSVDEFVAEAFSNPDFQDLLRSIKVEKTSVWGKLMEFVRSWLGLDDTKEINNALDAIMSTTDKLFTGELQRPTEGMRSAALNMPEEEVVRPTAANVIDKALQTSRIVKNLRERAVNAVEGSKEGSSKFWLSAMTMEQIKDTYAKYFQNESGAHPLDDYMNTFFKRNADNSANLEKADALSRKWTSITEKLGPEKSVELSRIMTEATLYGIHPDRVNNLTSTVAQDREAALKERWRKLSPELKDHYHEIAKYYADTLKTEVNLTVLNALRAYLTKGEEGGVLSDEDFDYKEADVEKLGLNTKEGLENEFGAFFQDHPSALKTIMTIANIPKLHTGPYFPLMRPGDYIVTAEKQREQKTFGTAEEARAYANDVRADDPTLSVSFPKQDPNGGYFVTVTEKEVRMAESPSEAEANRKEMIAQYGEGHVSPVQLKAQLYQRTATISNGSALGTILNKLEGNPAAQSAIKDFYLRSLADGAFRKRELKRANRRGVNYDQQHRYFATYAKQSAYYTSQLRFGWKMADALIDMQKFVEEHGGSTGMSAVKMGEVVREIVNRDTMTTDPVKVSGLVRKASELSQFMMLTSPSYWMINSTQPYMVTLPWLAARSDVGTATGALLNAQKMILDPLVSQMGESWLGLKALGSKAAAERAFTVLEQVEQHIRERGGSRSQEYLKMLSTLKRDSIIDLSFVAELRDIAQGVEGSLGQRVLDASRIMGHLTEVNNRIMTAIAAYDIARNGGAEPIGATEFAKRAVSTTQFNYSSGNTPRLFTTGGPLGKMGPLVFQFMKYPQHMYAMLISNMRAAAGDDPTAKRIALKTLAGIFATHLAAGGVIGAMVQPIKWAIGLALAMFGSDDEPYTVANALSGETFDRLIREASSELFGTEMGEIVSAGLPRAAGIDLSNRMALGSLYFIDLKSDTADSMLGSLVASFGGPSLNLGLGFFKGAQYMADGQVEKGMESFLPKAAKDALRAIRYSNEGLTDASGKEILNAKQLSPWQIFMQSIGFQPSTVSETYARRQAIKDAQSNDELRRTSLLKRFRSARTQEDQKQIAIEIAEWNKANPAQSITRSQLIKSIVAERQSEQRIQKFGADLTRKELGYANDEEGIYNVEDEE